MIVATEIIYNSIYIKKQRFIFYQNKKKLLIKQIYKTIKQKHLQIIKIKEYEKD